MGVRKPAAGRLRLLLLVGIAAALGAALVGVRNFRRSQAVESVTAGRLLTPLCAAAVQAQCSKRIDCGQMDRAQREACIDELGAQCERSLGWKLRAGVVTVNEEPQEECIEAMNDATCNALKAVLGDDDADLFELTHRCEMNELLQPHSGPGSACSDSSDCIEDYCPKLSSECHRCRPFVPLGGACSPGALVCNPAVAACVGPLGHSTCQPIARLAVAAQSCRETADCATGLFCKTVSGQRVCALRSKTEDACVDEPGSCAEMEANCVAGRCQVRPFALRAGESCRTFTDCAPGLYCKGTHGGREGGRCVEQEAPGRACEALDFGACPVDAACYNGRCHKLRAAGQKCNSPIQCKAFLSCVPASTERGLEGDPTCRPYAMPGEACNQYLPCVASFCDPAAGKCVPLSPGGTSCTVPQQCDSHWCLPEHVCYAPCAADGAAPTGTNRSKP